MRPIRRQELEELLPLVDGYQRFYGAEPNAERNGRFFSRFLHPSDEGLLLGAWANGGLVGFATLYWFHSSTKAADTVLMNDLFVREDVRGGGIGRALIQAALDEARQRGAGHLEWYTGPDNLAAQRLYDSLPGVRRSTWHAYEVESRDDSIRRTRRKDPNGMRDDLRTESSITINAPAARVWEALTTPDLIKQWFFGVDTVTDWMVGSPITHRGEYQGKPYEDKGSILQIEPPTLLVHSHWSPLSRLPDSPENYQRVSWALSERHGETELTITEANLPSEEAKAISEKSWQTVLGNLKRLLQE